MCGEAVEKGYCMEFVHPALNEEVNAIGGHYMFTKEDLLAHPAGDILYLVGYAATDTSCCGPGGCGYAIVPGHINSLRFRLNGDNRYISATTPVDERFYVEVTNAIRRKEGINQVHFLLASGGKKIMY